MIDYTDSNNLTAMTDDEIKRAIEALTNESAYRKRQREAHLIDNFKKAFYALKDAGMDMHYSLQDEGWEDEGIDLVCWDNFYFD